ncbi:MAG: hypothetical protein DRQ24_09420 [Candidatus Latescibacterota bacterium]|nr:MAG: hypothetical protein DRQ24_09420 [Candidatus Latescibacterota bacterium]
MGLITQGKSRQTVKRTKRLTRVICMARALLTRERAGEPLIKGVSLMSCQEDWLLVKGTFGNGESVKAEGKEVDFVAFRLVFGNG